MKRATVVLAVLAVAATVGANAAQAAGSWQLVAQSTDRNSVSPSPSLIAEELWNDRNRVVARSTRRARVTWKLTCHAYDYSVGGIDSTRTARGIAWVRPRVNRTVTLPSLGSLLPAWAKPRVWNGELIFPDVSTDCWATVTLDTAYGKPATAGLWLQRWAD